MTGRQSIEFSVLITWLMLTRDPTSTSGLRLGPVLNEPKRLETPMNTGVCHFHKGTFPNQPD